MTIAAIPDLIELLRQQRLLEPPQLEELPKVQGQHQDLKAFAGELIGRGWLTPYQVNLLLQGRGQELLLGSYVLLERLGEGGMGIVYKARHRHMKRIVAIKLIRKQRLANPAVVKRFQREVRAAAQLDHVNVVHAFDADQVGDSHALIMEFVDGIDLARLVKQRGPLPIEQAGDFIRQAALGLQHAYERGLVHRDIKPANLLVAKYQEPGSPGARSKGGLPPSGDSGTAGGQGVASARGGTGEFGLVKILDMGLARVALAADEEFTTTVTEEGMIAGTPDYMAPEQTLGLVNVDIRSDLYSLGCTFYFLLTGRAPFAGGTGGEKIAKHLSQDPVAVEQLRPEVPAGMAGVLRRLLAKRPGDRYDTPADLAEVLETGLRTGHWPDPPPAFAPGPPLAYPLETSAAPVAIPPGRGADAATPTPLALAAFGSKSDIALAVPPVSGETATKQRSATTTKRAALPVRLDRRQAVLAAAVLGSVLWLALGTGLLFVPGAGWVVGVLLWLGLIGAGAGGWWLVRAGYLPRQQAVLAAAALGLIFWPAFGTGLLFLPGAGPIAGVLVWLGLIGAVAGCWWAGYLPRRQAVLAAAALGMVLWLILGTGLLFVPGAGWVVGVLLWLGLIGAGAGGWWLVRAGHLPLALLEELFPKRLVPAAERYEWQPAELTAVIGSHAWKHWGPVRGLAVRPDGRQLASCGDDGAVRLWDVDTGRELLVLRHRGVSCLAFAPDGQQLVTGSRGGTVYCWDAQSGERKQSLHGHQGPVMAVACSPDGQSVASAGRERDGERDIGCIRLWNAADGTERTILKQAGMVQAIAFAPDGKTLASAGTDMTVKLWDPAVGQELATLAGHTDEITALAFAADGKYLATGGGGKDPRVRVWDWQARKELLAIEQVAAVGALALTPDSQSVAGAGSDGTIKVAQLASGQEQATLRGHVGPVHAVAFTRDGKVLVSAGRDGTVRHWDPATWHETTAIFKYTPGAFAADGTLVLLAGKTGKLIDAASGKERGQLPAQPAPLSWAACSPDGKLLATGSLDRSIKLWDPATGQERATVPLTHSRPPRCGVFAPDGKLLFSAAHEGKGTGELRLWDLDQQSELPLPRHITDRIAAAQFSPAGRLLALTGADGTRLVDLPAGQERWAQTQGGRGIAFAPDGKTLAWAFADASTGSVKLWDVESDKQRATIKAHRGPVLSLAFAPDGSALATTGADGLVILWDPATGSRLRDWQLPGPVARILFAPNGQHLALGNGNGTVYVLKWNAAGRDR